MSFEPFFLFSLLQLEVLEEMLPRVPVFREGENVIVNDELRPFESCDELRPFYRSTIRQPTSVLFIVFHFTFSLSLVQ